LAHLADADPEAAAAGADAALEAVTATDTTRRRPALRLIAAVAESDPDRVAGADRGVAGALADPAPDVRSAGALCAATLLSVAPGTFPRTASALVDRLDDPDPDVRAHVRIALVRFARNHPAQVPEKRAAVEALGATADRDLGLTGGATKEALTSLLEVVHGYSF
ncbi:MAG: adaptin, partial [Haloferacaceae archaeon]